MTIRHRILLALFGVGAFAGFGSGFAHARHCRAAHAAFERRPAGADCLEGRRRAAPPSYEDDDR